MKNNKRRGNTWERTIVKYLKDLGYEEPTTCRNESKIRDDQKVDICSLPGWNIQAKTLHTPIHPEKIIPVMPEEDAINVIFYKKTKKSGNRFMSEGEYAILRLEDFLELMRKIDEKNSTS